MCNAFQQPSLWHRITLSRNVDRTWIRARGYQVAVHRHHRYHVRALTYASSTNMWLASIAARGQGNTFAHVKWWLSGAKQVTTEQQRCAAVERLWDTAADRGFEQVEVTLRDVGAMQVRTTLACSSLTSAHYYTRWCSALQRKPAWSCSRGTPTTRGPRPTSNSTARDPQFNSSCVLNWYAGVALCKKIRVHRACRQKRHDWQPAATNSWPLAAP